MEVVIEAISDLKSACADRQPRVRSHWQPPTDLVSVLQVEGHIKVRADLRPDSQGEGVIVVNKDRLVGSDFSSALQRGTEASTAPSWSRNSLSMTSALKAPYSNPSAALADYPASILQRTT